MNITNAQYIKDITDNKIKNISCTIDSKSLIVPIDTGNRHYVEIKKQLDAGTLTISDAE